MSATILVEDNLINQEMALGYLKKRDSRLMLLTTDEAILKIKEKIITMEY